MRWIEGSYGPVPIEFARLLDASTPGAALCRAIDELVTAKVAGNELDEGPRIPIISEFIEREMARFETREANRRDVAPSLEGHEATRGGTPVPDLICEAEWFRVCGSPRLGLTGEFGGSALGGIEGR
jgi:RNA repair pathway DNA polymerase beta family